MTLARRFFSVLIVSLLSLIGGVNSETVIERAREFAQSIQYETWSYVPEGCPACCKYIRYIFPKQTHFPGDSTYEEQQQSYWSEQQARTLPLCRFSPDSSEDVAAALYLIYVTDCEFAVKAGGYAAFAGASNAHAGLTIDLSRLKTLEVSPADESIVEVGAGSRWRDVDSFLKPLNRAVVGPRARDLGVGGTILGGGISSFSGSRGWSLDYVKNYEAWFLETVVLVLHVDVRVVIGRGKIAHVNQSSNPDLYFALRGGGNNFGIVTRFDLETFEPGELWTSRAEYESSNDALVSEAFSWFAKHSGETDESGLKVTVSTSSDSGFSLSGHFESSKPGSESVAFEKFASIPTTSSTMGVSSFWDVITDQSIVTGQGLRHLSTTWTFLTNAQLMIEVIAIFKKSIESNLEEFSDLKVSLTFEPVTSKTLSAMSRNGGNALGLNTGDGPFTIVILELSWSSSESDTAITTIAEQIRQEAIALAMSRDLHHRYICQNYADSSQDVFAGYGPENKQRLLGIQAKSDRYGIFHDLQPGYFKMKERRIQENENSETGSIILDFFGSFFNRA